MSNYTIGDIISELGGIETKSQATVYLDKYAKLLKRDLSPGVYIWKEERVKRAKRDIGYIAGYLTRDERERVEELFDCEHPFLGSIKKMGRPTGEEVFLCGYLMKPLEEIRKMPEEELRIIKQAAGLNQSLNTGNESTPLPPLREDE